MSLYNVVGAASLVAGQPEDVSQVLANFQAIQTILNGGIDNTNINAAAAIAATKLSGYPSDATKFLRGDNTWSVAIRNVTPTIILNGTVLYTTPTGSSEICVEAIGGGGAGGGTPVTAAGQGSFAGAGGTGGYSMKFVQAPAASYACAVGAGGTGVSGLLGNVGGNTTFNVSTVVANGGNGGAAGVATAAAGIGGAGGSGGAAGTGDLTIAGTTGQNGFAIAASFGVGGPPAAAPVYGSGARNGVSALPIPGAAGALYGGSGGGALAGASAAAQLGGAGANGIIVVWNYS